MPKEKEVIKVTNAESLYVLEYAVTADSKCKGFTCSNRDIELHELRIGKLGKSKYGNTKFGTDVAMMPKWYHLSCLFEELSKARASTHIITSSKDFRCGWESLQAEDKAKLQTFMKDLVKARKEEADIKKGAKKNKKGNEDSDSDEEKPAKKKAKLVRASESLIQAAFPYDVWVRVASVLPLKDLLHLSLVSQQCKTASRQILLKDRGVIIGSKEGATTPPASLVPLIERLSLKSREFKWLKDCTNLTSLELDSISYNVELTTAIGHLTKLTDLSLVELSYGSGGDDVVAVAKKLPHLRTLYFHGCQSVAIRHHQAGTNWIDRFAQLTSLTSLSLCRGIDDFPLSAPSWTALQNLTSLDMTRTSVAPSWLPIFAQLPNLTSLMISKADSIYKNKFNCGDTYDFSQLSNLQMLSIDTLKNLTLPPSLVTFKLVGHPRFDTPLPALPPTLKDLFIHVRYDLSDNFLSAVPSHCRIHLSTLLEMADAVPMDKIHELTLFQVSWPANKKLLDVIEGLGSKPLPPLVELAFNLRSCGYKKKVYAAVDSIRLKANILVTKFDLTIFDMSYK